MGHNKRIARHRVFDDLAARGKTSMGWFFDFKLHLVVNDAGELLAARLTPGNVDDRGPVPEMVGPLTGKLFGDKDYISGPLFSRLFDQGLHLVTPIRRNRHNRLLPLWDKILLRQRSLIDTSNDQLKTICPIEHSRHRSPKNFCVTLICGLICYALQDKKPCLRFDDQEQDLLSELLLDHETQTLLV